MEISLTVSLIAIIATIVIPAITNYMNNRHKRKMWKMRFYYEHRAQVVEDYIHFCGMVIQDQTNRSFLGYEKASQEIYLYVQEELWPILDTIYHDLYQVRNFPGDVDNDVLKRTSDNLKDLVKSLASVQHPRPKNPK